MTRFSALTEEERRALVVALATAFVMADSRRAWVGLIRAFDELEAPEPNAVPRQALVEQVRWATIGQKHDLATKFVGAVVRGYSDAACVELLAASATAKREALLRTHPIWDGLAGITSGGALMGPTPEKPAES